MGEFTFKAQENPESWVMKITQEGIKFNRDKYPYTNTEEFAKSVIDILEHCYEVKFTKKYPPYEKVECSFCNGKCHCGLRQRSLTETEKE